MEDNSTEILVWREKSFFLDFILSGNGTECFLHGLRLEYDKKSLHPFLFFQVEKF